MSLKLFRTEMKLMIDLVRMVIVHGGIVVPLQGVASWYYICTVRMWVQRSCQGPWPITEWRDFIALKKDNSLLGFHS